MNKYLQILASIFVLFLSFSVISCSSIEPQATDGSTLDVPMDTLRLTIAKPSDTLKLKLSCGCGFRLDSLERSGDVTAINCQPVELLNNTTPEHKLYFSYTPGIGAKSMKVNFTAHKQTYTYTNSVVVTTE